MMSNITNSDPSLLTPTAAVPVVGSQPRTATRRVLHLINGEHYSGAERVQDLLASCLPDNGYEVGFACLKPGKFPGARTAKQARLFETPMKAKLDLAVIKRLAEIVVEERYEALHAHTPRTLLLAALLKPRVKLPLVYHVHSPTSRDSTRPIHNWINNFIERQSLRRVDRLITVSQSLASHMRDLRIDANRISVVPNGVPICDNRRNASPPIDTWTVGTVALFRPRKGIEVLIQAVAELRKTGRDVRVLAVGPFETPEYEKQIKQLVDDFELAPFVEWTGFTRDVNAQLQRMDLFALPSMFGEGLPMVVLESMACGLPIVSTKVEGIPEAVRDGLDGALAEPNNPSDFAAAILRIKEVLDWNQLQQNAIARHAEKFSDQAMARGVAEVYDSLLGERGTSSP